MTLEEYNNNLQQVHGLTDNLVNLVIAPNGIKMLLSIINRIQKQGKASNESPIGNYSQTPSYFSQTQFVKKGAFKPVGKGGDNVGNKLIPSVANPKQGRQYQRYKQVVATTGQKRKSMYLPHGYKEFRDIQGFQTSKVDWTLTGQSMRDYQAEIQGQSMILGITTKRSSDILRGNEKHFGQSVLSPSPTEINTYASAVNNQLTILTRNTIQGVNPQATVSFS